MLKNLFGAVGSGREVAGAGSTSSKPAVLGAAVRPVMEGVENRVLMSVGLLDEAVNYPAGNFSEIGMSLNAGAAISNKPYSPRLGLTTSGANESRSAFHGTPVDVRKFTSDFSYQLGGTVNGGWGFVIQGNEPTATGSSGNGYTGMGRSVAVGYRISPTLTQAVLGQNGTFTSFADIGPSGINFHSGHVIDVHVEYDGSTLTVTQTDAADLNNIRTATQTYPNINIPSLVGGNTAYVGFVGGTGAAAAGSQEVIGWEFANVLPDAGDVGSPAVAGSASVGVSTYSVTGAGTGIGGTSDQFHFLSKNENGDQEIIARVASPASGSGAASGLMIREGTGANAPFAFVGLTPSGATFRYRTATGAAAVSTGAGSGSWLKLVRNGNTLSGYVSPTGVDGTWTLVGTAGVRMADGVRAGLAVSSGNASSAATAQFADVSARAVPMIGVDTGDAGIWYKDSDQMWVNVINQAETWSKFAQIGTPAAVDARGWPAEDFRTKVLWGEVNNAGTYKLSMTVDQMPSVGVSHASIQNRQYDPVTKRFAADVVLNAPIQSEVTLSVSNTGGTGARDIRLIRPGYAADTTQVFTDNYINFLKSLDPSALRLMNFLNTNQNPVRTWAERNTPASPSQAATLQLRWFDGSPKTGQFSGRGIAWEYGVMLANAVHADLWLNIPAQADDDYIRQVADVIKNGSTVDGVYYPPLAPDLNIYIEYSNEVWNSGFDSFRYTGDAALAEVKAEAAAGRQSNLNYDNQSTTPDASGNYGQRYVTWGQRFYTRRLVQITQAFADAFGQDAVNTRVRSVLSNRPNLPQFEDTLKFVQNVYGAPANYFHSIGMVPYMNMNGPDNSKNLVNGGNENPNLTVDDVLTNLALNAQALNTQHINFSTLAKSYGLKMTAYEGGVDTSSPQGSGVNGPKANAGRDPRVAGVIQQYFANWFSHGGDAAMYFTANASQYGHRFGDFTLTEDITDVNASKARGFRASREAERNAPAPAAASNVRVTGATSSTVSVAWNDNSDNEQAFKVEIATDNKFSQNLVTTVTPAGATAWTVTGLAAGMTYYVRVRAANTAGDSLGSGFVIANTGGTRVAPPAPQNVSARGVSSSQVQLTWTDLSSSETGFKVDVAKDSSFSQIAKTVDAPVDATTFNVFGLDQSSTFYFRVRAANQAGESGNSNTSNAAQTSAAVVTGYWNFDEPSGNVANDLGITPAAPGTIGGGVTRVAGWSGGALDFDGTTGFVDVGNMPKLQLRKQGTVAAWIKPDAITKHADIVIQDWDGLNYPFYLSLAADGQTAVFGTYRFVNTSSPFIEAKGSAGYPLADGNWHHVAGTYDGTHLRVFIDGQLVGTMADPYGITSGSQPLNFGRNSNNGGGSRDYFDGALDEVKIWNVGMSDGDVARLAAQGPVQQTPPNAPSNLVATAASGTQVNLTWSDGSNNESGFTVERSTDNATWTLVANVGANVTAASATGLTAGGTYFFRVRAFNGAGGSANATAGPVTTPTTAVTPPAAPTNLAATAVSGTQVNLTWNDASNNEDGFVVESSTDNANWSPVTTTGAGAQSHSVTGLTAGANYYFRVRAFNGAGASANATAGPVATPVGAPAAPAQFLAQAQSSSTVRLTWRDVSQNETGFAIERSTDNANWQLVVNTPNGEQEYIVTGLSGGTTYYFRIRSFNAGGSSENVASGPVATPSDGPVIPAAPSNLTGQATSSTQINLTWADNSNNETGFVVERSTDNANWTNVTTTGAGVTSFNVTGLTASTAYYFRVRAVNTAGPSANATAGPISTQAAPPPTSDLVELTGTPFGTAGSYGNIGNTFAKVFDDNLTTYFDAPQANGVIAGLDLGSAKTVSAIRFAPRSGYEQRMVGGKFQGSNTSSTSGFVDLATVTAKPAGGVFSTAQIATPAAYRWVRYVAPDGSWGNVAEIEIQGPATQQPPPTQGKLTGALFGTAGSYGNIGNTAAKAIDGSFATYFDAPQANGVVVGLDLGTAARISAVKFAPRAGFEGRMVGGRFQGSNTSSTAGFVDLFTVTSAPAAGSLTTGAVTDTTAYRWVRYLAPDGSWGNVSEIEFHGGGGGTTQPPPTSPQELTGPSFGTAGSYNNQGNTIAKAFDNDLATYFDGPAANGNVLGLDLGSANTITSIKFAPRSGFAGRMVGGRFQGSNSSPTDGFVDLYTITSAPTAGLLTTVTVANATPFRYVRYVAPDGSWGNVAEVEFYGSGSTPSAPAKLTGTGFGSPGSYNNLGNTFDKALDGNPATFFDAPVINCNYAGLDLGTAKRITSVKFLPRSGFANRMVGGKFQGSNTSPTEGFVDLFTITSAPAADGSYTTATVSDPTAYRYVRYLSPDGSWGNVAEVEFYG